MTEPSPITLADIEAAAARIAGHVRRTPSLPLVARVGSELDGLRVTFKLEHLQAGGSFKARGAVNRLALAGLLAGRARLAPGAHVGVVLCGANLDVGAVLG